MRYRLNTKASFDALAVAWLHTGRTGRGGSRIHQIIGYGRGGSCMQAYNLHEVASWVESGKISHRFIGR